MMRLMHRHSMLTVTATLYLAACSIPSAALDAFAKQAVVNEVAGKIHIAANSPRPLAQILNALQENYGWQINYEDARYTFKPDFSEVAAPHYLNPKAGATIKVPSGGAFTIEVGSSKDSATMPDEEKTLRSIVESYNQSGNPGRFEVRKSTTGSFEIVGIGAHDPSGKIASTQPALDFPIFIPRKQRSAFQAVQAICTSLSQHGHIPVSLGVYPTGLFRVTRSTIGGSRIEARLLLAEALQATGRKMSWRLLYDPETRTYVLNVAPVASPPQPPSKNEVTRNDSAAVKD